MNSFKLIDGIKCYSLGSISEKENFEPENFEILYLLEGNNFWFNSRNNIINSLFDKFLSNSIRPKVLEIGCGTGFVLQSLSKKNKYDLYGSEFYLEGLYFAKERLPQVEFIQLDARNIPFANEFNAIGAFDVLEHIEEDDLVIKNVYKALKSKGLFFITVPQHKWLWSMQDETSFHKRRYSREELIKKLTSEGFTIKFVTSYVFILLPIMFFSRFLKKKTNKSMEKYDFSELNLPPLINNVGKFLMSIDQILIKTGFSLPCGGSLAIVASKDKE